LLFQTYIILGVLPMRARS